MGRKYSNTAVDTELSTGVTSSSTTIKVASTTGFPSVDFTLALDVETSTEELVLVTAISGTTLTVTRGYDNTPAQAHEAGAPVRHVHAAVDFRDSRSHEASTSGAHGTTGHVVGTSGSQTLTNKDLTSATNTFPDSLATDSDITTLTSYVDTQDGTLQGNIDDVVGDLATHEAATAVHGVSGNVVGTTDAQTLTNKTFGDDCGFSSDHTDSSMVGEVRMWAPATIPGNWLECDGSAVSRATYSALFAAIGTTYGSGDGSSTFNLPDARRRFPVGAVSGSTTELGHTDGISNTDNRTPGHDHGIFANGTYSDVRGVPSGSASFNTATRSALEAHNHGGSTGNDLGFTGTDDVFPHIAFNFIIRYQ